MKSLQSSVIATSIVVFCFSYIAQAQDQILLSNDATFIGEQTGEDSATGRAEVKLDNGIQVTMPRSNLKAVVVSTESIDSYRSKSPNFADTPQAQSQIANILNGMGLRDLAAAHFQRVVELDSTDKSAWRSLGYSETSGGWIPNDIYWKSKGMIRDGGKWRTPQDAAVAQSIEERKRASNEMRRKVESALRDMNANGKRGDEARAFFRDLRSHYALQPLFDKLIEDETTEDQKLFLLDVILGLDAKGLHSPIIKIMIRENSVQVRELCIDYLVAHPSEAAIQELQSYLTNNSPLKDNPETINRAAYVLGLIGDERCIPRLIDVVVTKHKVREIPAGNTQVTRTNGQMSFQHGNKPIERDLEKNNPEVLGALNQITGASLDYDKDAWLKWYAQYIAQTNLQLRRDP
jgi:hypothetical protein